MDHDPYPPLNLRQRAWLTGLFDGLVSRPSELKFTRMRDGNDLELMVSPAETDRAVFTEEVCRALETIVGAATGVPSPVIYLRDEPHPRAKAAIDAARYDI